MIVRTILHSFSAGEQSQLHFDISNQEVVPVRGDEDCKESEKVGGGELTESVTEVVDDQKLLKLRETVLLAQQIPEVWVSGERGEEGDDEGHHGDVVNAVAGAEHIQQQWKI